MADTDTKPLELTYFLRWNIKQVPLNGTNWKIGMFKSGKYSTYVYKSIDFQSWNK